MVCFVLESVQTPLQCWNGSCSYSSSVNGYVRYSILTVGTWQVPVQYVDEAACLLSFVARVSYRLSCVVYLYGTTPR